jgi:hypothetical protein
MVNPRYVTITVHYDGRPSYEGSLEWIAPELKGSAFTMTEDHLGDPTPTRTWAGLVDERTYERLAEAWRLPEDDDETDSHGEGAARDLGAHAYTLDGMNWESGGDAPIVCVSLQVARPRAMNRSTSAQTRPSGPTTTSERPSRR